MKCKSTVLKFTMDYSMGPAPTASCHYPTIFLHYVVVVGGCTLDMVKSEIDQSSCLFQASLLRCWLSEKKSYLDLTVFNFGAP